MKLYLTFHSYGPYILHPWGYKYNDPKNVVELRSLGQSVMNAIKRVRGKVFPAGSSAKLFGQLIAGSSDDWMMSKGNVPLSYTIEMQSGENRGPNQGFVMSPYDIMSNVKEVYEGVKVFKRYIVMKYS